MLRGEGLACVRGERIVFRGLDFGLARGEAMLLVGPNGAGKSSLLRLIAGLVPLAEGRLTWDGLAVADDPDAHRARLAYAGHLDALKPAMTLAENLGFWARLAGAEGAIDAALERFDLADLADLPARFLSAGQRRRLGLARLALDARPLWLLDEPSVSLDAASVARLAALVAEHRARGGMVLAASHVDLGLDGASVLDLGRR
jgi:heme exporter protein A